MTKRACTFAEILRDMAGLDEGNQNKLRSWLTSLACPGFRIRKRGRQYFVDLGDGRLIPVDGDPEFFEACKQLPSFMKRLQSDLWGCPMTAIRQEADEARNTGVENAHKHLHRANTLLHRATVRIRSFRRKTDHELNEAIVRLRDEPLPDGKMRPWWQVRKELRAINKKWHFTKDGTIRIRYQRLKRKQSPPGP